MESPNSVITNVVPRCADLHQQARVLEEVLYMTRQDLHGLLTCDHLPEDGIAQINVMKDALTALEWLVSDTRARIAMFELSTMSM